MSKFAVALYQAYEKSDASLFEINPVFKTSDSLIMAADAKVNIDDNALYRHADYAAMRDLNEEDPTEVEAGKFNLNFIKTGWKRGLHGQWGWTGHGHHGHHQAFGG
jgi:succinyl-CoA synthetase beta subunit